MTTQHSDLGFWVDQSSRQFHTMWITCPNAIDDSLSGIKSVSIVSSKSNAIDPIRISSDATMRIWTINDACMECKDRMDPPASTWLAFTHDVQ